MAKSNAERQREYRQRQLVDVEGSGARLNTIIDHGAKLSLTRLASAYGLSQRAMLERVIAEAEDSLMAGLSAKNQTAYSDMQLEVSE